MTTHLLNDISPHLQTITLNRPAALNALDHDMILGLEQAAMANDERPVLVTGAGDRAFCAGGDIKAAYAGGLAARNGSASLDPVLTYFRDEYRMNGALAATSRITLALMNGVTMGGGVGVAAPCKYRIACESTRWAMPETGIAFFPDVGAMFYLHQTPGAVGRYLALTGHVVGHPSAMLEWGLATHFIPVGRHAALIEMLDENTVDDIPNILADFHVTPPVAKEIEDDVLAVFEQADPIAILNDLRGIAPDVAKTLSGRSPHSVMTAATYYDWAAGRSLDEILAKDNDLVTRFLHHPDFYEGIRAQVIDKDRNPQWSDASLEAVDRERIAGYF